MQNLAKDIKKWAMELGFDDCGFAKTHKIEGQVRQHFDKWIGLGYNAGMDWIKVKNIDIRFNPELLLENAKTAIVLLKTYSDVLPIQTERGKIARCKSLSEDYHVTVKTNMAKLAEKIAEIIPEATFRPCVDSAPILEKYWAQKSGLGEIGKNTLFFSDKIGSLCNIGILLTSIELPETQRETPAKNFCLTCNNCLDKCPNKALTEPYLINCNNCISYQTIHKTESDFNFAGWDKGCDICQEVCPRNAKFLKKQKAI